MAPKIRVIIPKPIEQYHYVWTIWRRLTINQQKNMESFNEEVGELLDSGYSCLGISMAENKICAVMAKLIVNSQKSEEEK